MARVKKPPAYDPRYERAQTVEGAKARYVSDDLPDYREAELEADLDRIIRFEGPNPDRPRAESEPILGGIRVRSDGGDPANEKLDRLMEGGYQSETIQK